MFKADGYHLAEQPIPMTAPNTSTYLKLKIYCSTSRWVTSLGDCMGRQSRLQSWPSIDGISGGANNNIQVLILTCNLYWTYEHLLAQPITGHARTHGDHLDTWQKSKYFHRRPVQ